MISEDQAGEEESIVQQLVRAWLNEKNAPELLPFEFDLIQDVIELVESQMEQLELTPAQGTVEMAFVRCIYQIELERIKYMLQSYFRARISKIERWVHALKALPRDQQVRLMSKSEIEHATRYRQLTEQAIRVSVLEDLPPQLRGFPDLEETRTALPGPDLDAHVVVRFKEDVPELLIDPLAQSIEQNIQSGDMYILQYATIKDLLARQAVELL